MKLRNKKDSLVEQEEQRQDLGFGKQITDPTIRLVNQDGTFNVQRINMPFWGWLNIYHRLITMPWRNFGFAVFIMFLIVNSLFAGLYVLAGLEHLQGIDMSTPMAQFWDAFFFSAQTLTTVGYGRIAPVGFWASAVAAVESLLGLLAFAIATGLVYGRFSRPVAHIRFSEKALISPYLDTTGLMFRIANERSNQLIEISVEVALSRLEDLPNGKRTRKYYGLTLERSRINFFPLNWTIVHPIMPDSPLYGVDEAELLRSDSEFLIFIKATEDTFTQTVHARSSYNAKDVVWGAKFKKMYNNAEAGITTIDLDKLSDIEPIAIPVMMQEMNHNSKD